MLQTGGAAFYRCPEIAMILPSVCLTVTNLASVGESPLMLKEMFAASEDANCSM